MMARTSEVNGMRRWVTGPWGVSAVQSERFGPFPHLVELADRRQSIAGGGASVSVDGRWTHNFAALMAADTMDGWTQCDDAPRAFLLSWLPR